jgi:hypothetical protein
MGIRLLGNRSSWRNRIAARLMAAYVRPFVNVPVDAPARGPIVRLPRP